MNRTHRLSATYIAITLAFFLASGAYAAPQAAETPQAPDAAHATEASQAPQPAQTPQAPDTSHATDAAQAPQPAQTSQAPDASHATDATQAPQPAQTPQAPTAAVAPSGPSAPLWQDRGNIASLDLIGGPGGKEHQPVGKFTFVKEDMEGTSPKFDVVDEQGVRWRVKMGEESRSETAATRLVWAVGYFTDEDYYLPEVHVEKMPKLHRGSHYVSADGVVRGARLERKLKGQKKSGNWSWSSNPYIGTKELNGLRIMMALVNNWDLKENNNAIYQEKGEGPRYVVSDLGATFGRTGNPLIRSKDNLRDYRRTRFIQEVKANYVDFILSSRPFSLTVVDLPNYVTRTKMQAVVKHIPLADARWLGQLLGQLSADQIRDCFRAAGYSPEEVEGFATVVQGRIAELNRLPAAGEEGQKVAGRR